MHIDRFAIFKFDGVNDAWRELFKWEVRAVFQNGNDPCTFTWPRFFIRRQLRFHDVVVSKFCHVNWSFSPTDTACRASPCKPEDADFRLAA